MLCYTIEYLVLNFYLVEGLFWSAPEGVKLGVDLMEGKLLLQLVVLLTRLVQLRRLLLQLKTWRVLYNNCIERMVEIMSHVLTNAEKHVTSFHVPIANYTQKVQSSERLK